MQWDEFSARERSFFLPSGELNRSRLLKRVYSERDSRSAASRYSRRQISRRPNHQGRCKKWRARVSGKISVQENILGLATGALTSHIFSSLGLAIRACKRDEHRTR